MFRSFHAALPILLFSTLSFADEQTEVKSLDELEWLIGTSEGTTKLPEDTEGFGKKGDEVTLRVTTERSLDGHFLLAKGVVMKDNNSKHVFMEIWGMHPAHRCVHKWMFDVGGAMFEGKVLWEGDDKVVHAIEGTAVPKGEGPIVELAKTLKLEKLPYSGEVVFRRIGEDTIGVTVRSVKIAGSPFPWPNLGVEELHRRVK